MSQATYTQDGRSLHVVIDGAFDATIPPVNLQQGRTLTDSLAALAVGYGGDAGMEKAIIDALGGVDTYEKVQGLRPEEFTEIANVAIFWQAYGGGWPVVNAYLEANDSDPKAVEPVVALLFRRGAVNLKQVASRLSTSSGSPTPSPDGPDMSSREKSAPPSPDA